MVVNENDVVKGIVSLSDSLQALVLKGGERKSKHGKGEVEPQKTPTSKLAASSGNQMKSWENECVTSQKPHAHYLGTTGDMGRRKRKNF